jgi:predicted RNA-binding Zn-ribbon protein involved in translation (DUF1610 family)
MTESTDLDSTVTCASCRRETTFEHARADLSGWRASSTGDSYCVTCLGATRLRCAGCRRESTVDAARWEAWQFAQTGDGAFCAGCAGSGGRPDLVMYCGSCGRADAPGSQYYPNVCDRCSNWGIW